MTIKRTHNGITYRWTRKGWKPTVKPGQPAHWSAAHPAGLKNDVSPNVPEDADDDSEGQGDHRF